MAVDLTFNAHKNLVTYTKHIALPDANIHLYDSSTGSQAIILLHGLGDDADTWAHILPALATEGYRVIALDWPGSGRSTCAQKVTINGHYATLLALVKALGIERFHLVGHSMGAMIAHRFTAEHADMIISLTLFGGMLGTEQGKLSMPLLLSLLPGIGELRYTRLRLDPDAAFQSLYAYYADVNALPDYDREFLYKRVNQRVWSNALRKAYFSLLRSLPVWMGSATEAVLAGSNTMPPTTVAFGEKDIVVSPDAAKATSSKLAIPYHVIPDAGHNVQQEQPDTAVKMILETIKHEER